MNRIAVNARFLVHSVGGMQRYALELCRRFGPQVDLIRPTSDLKGISGHLWEQFGLPAHVGSRFLWSPDTTGPLALARQICTFHDLLPIEHPEWFNPQFTRWYQLLLPRLARRVAHIIVNSQFTKESVIGRLAISPEKVTVTPFGVDARFSPRNEDEIAMVRERLGIGSAPYVLCTQAFVERKNTSRLLRVWQQISPKLPANLKLVLAGGKGGGGVVSTFHLDQLPAKVLATGYVNDDDLPALYSGASAFVYPSLYEGFGLPTLEAMACGTPVLTSNSSALPEVVGNAALTIDPLDEEAMQDGLLRLLGSDSLRADLRTKGLERVRSFTWDHTAEQTWRLLNQAM
jgi:glycosyltransferase involved in cell wall biosynthesis